MPRAHYQDGWGVLPLKWRVSWSSGDGYPRDRGIVLVEVWRPGVAFWELLKPKAQVDARFELWVHRNVTGWHRITPNGDLEPIAEMPMVRRWATLNASKTWTGTIALEGWK